MTNQILGQIEQSKSPTVSDRSMNRLKKNKTKNESSTNKDIKAQVSRFWELR